MDNNVEMHMHRQLTSQEKYNNMVKEAAERLILTNFELNTVCDKTLNEVIHLQESFKLRNSEHFKEVLNFNQEKKTNDTYEFFYNKNYTICPLLFDIIMNMSSPDELGGINLPYSNQKTLVFDYTNIFDKEIFEREYLTPFYNEEVVPKLEEAYKEILNKRSEYQENYLKYVRVFFKLY